MGEIDPFEMPAPILTAVQIQALAEYPTSDGCVAPALAPVKYTLLVWDVNPDRILFYLIPDAAAAPFAKALATANGRYSGGSDNTAEQESALGLLMFGMETDPRVYSHGPVQKYGPGTFQVATLFGALVKYETMTPIQLKAGDVIEAVYHAGFML